MQNTALTTTPQTAIAPQTETKDANGNLVMNLKDIGLDGNIRYHRFEDGVKFAMIDVVKTLIQKDGEYSGQ